MYTEPAARCPEITRTFTKADICGRSIWSGRDVGGSDAAEGTWVEQMEQRECGRGGWRPKDVGGAGGEAGIKVK